MSHRWSLVISVRVIFVLVLFKRETMNYNKIFEIGYVISNVFVFILDSENPNKL